MSREEIRRRVQENREKCVVFYVCAILNLIANQISFANNRFEVPREEWEAIELPKAFDVSLYDILRLSPSVYKKN